DFGVDAESVLSSLRFLDELRQRSNTKPTGGSRGYTLADQLKNHNVSHLQCTPSTARMLMMEPEATTALRSLRELMVGGEALPPALATQLGQTISGRIRNMYGPTETTIWSATHVVENGRRVVPIGQPIANTRIYIVDDHLRPTGVGLPGEILIGGDGVVRGYLQRPDLTAERFIPDPFGAAPGGRLYRTGDLGRYLPDGTIEFLGRLDHQVKILGHRIELGEIEAVLERHPAVREAVAVLREDSSGEPRLTAYLTVRQQPPPSTTELREYVKRELPAPMVPAAFLTLDRLPLTPNGKVDRRALPEAEQARAELEKPFVPPRTALEEVIAATWEKLLGIDRIGIDDNFFELGGHSLFAVRLLSQLRSVFKVDLPLRSLFDSPTVAALAEAIIRHESQPGQSEKIAQVVQHVEAMSAEDVRRKLEEKKARAAL
ncbi:MAG TPA: non-ribosomal peptide synthetase, partial [Candidatus Eisenbacteria bacterium]|nr:non-ribosomal peptide synthetase [Candidatus Eisenbacteria bacterium]